MASHLRTRTVVVLALALVAGLLAASPAAAQAPVNPRPGNARAGLLGGPFRPIMLQLRGLNLAPEQRQQVLGIFQAHQPEMRALAENMKAARARWQQAGQINIQERKELAGRRQAIMKAVRTEVFGVLTPAQQKRLQARRNRLARRR